MVPFWALMGIFIENLFIWSTRDWSVTFSATLSPVQYSESSVSRKANPNFTFIDFVAMAMPQIQSKKTHRLQQKASQLSWAKLKKNSSNKTFLLCCGRNKKDINAAFCHKGSILRPKKMSSIIFICPKKTDATSRPFLFFSKKTKLFYELA